MSKNLPFFLTYMTAIAAGFAFLWFVPWMMLRRIRNSPKPDPFRDWDEVADGHPTWTDIDRMKGIPRR